MSGDGEGGYFLKDEGRWARAKDIQELIFQAEDFRPK